MATNNRGYPDGSPEQLVILPYASPAGPGGMTVAELYAQVIWFRRSTFSSTLLLIALACWILATICGAIASSEPSRQAFAILGALLGILAGLALVMVCVVLLTGPVYIPKALPNGRLKTWGIANKVIALSFLAMFLATWAWICIEVLRAKR